MVHTRYIYSSESLDTCKKRIKLVNFSSLLDTVMSNTVDTTRVEKYLYERTICHDSRSPLDPTDRVVEWKMYRISSLKQRSDMNHSRVQGRYTVYPTFFKQLKIRHKSREGTSALHIVYVSFVKDFLHSYDSTTITQGPFPT